MKALLYKDFRVVWKQLKFVIIMVAVFCMLPNSAFNLSYFFVAYAGLVVPISLLAYDQQAKWDSLAAMLPYTSRDMVLSRYIFGWCATAFAALSYLVGAVFFRSDMPVSEELLFLALIVSLVLIMQSIYFPVIFRLGAEKGRLVMLGVLVIIAVLVGVALEVFDRLHLILPNLMGPLGVLLTAGVCLASVKVSVRQYEKRVW